jgi:hypothetical protein
MWAFGGEVRWLMGKDGPCFDCTLREADLPRIYQRRSCSGFREDDAEPDYFPTIATTSSIIGGLLAQEAVKWLHAYPIQEGKAMVYNGQSLTLHRAELTRNPECRSNHFPYKDVIQLNEKTNTLTPRLLFEHVRKNFNVIGDLFLNLRRDFLLRMVCPKCNYQQDVFEQWAKVSSSVQICPKCASNRNPEVIATVSEMEQIYLDWTLSRLGVPPAEVVEVHSIQNMYLFELTSDLDESFS